jgi:SAM-dependent methyltransferase
MLDTIRRACLRFQVPFYQMSNWLGLGIEGRHASRFWASMEDFATYYEDPVAQGRSRWLCRDVLAPLNLSSLLEVGCNSGRNLAFAKQILGSLRLKGIDINARAIEYAKKRNPDILYEVCDANNWSEPPKSWDAILTMSVIDHIPDEVIKDLARNMVNTATKNIVCVELWDGGEGWRGPYKYSRDLRKLFEPLGVKTLKWEKSSGQYDEESSLLYLYIGQVP